mmetsp:Transcript_9875/g.28027  ORF Transcript_9875/g.28027 Transcript_9875/m.28027 type:complete len:302 (+) Transcript_9875:1093-1998(+)
MLDGDRRDACGRVVENVAVPCIASVSRPSSMSAEPVKLMYPLTRMGAEGSLGVWTASMASAAAPGAREDETATAGAFTGRKPSGMPFKKKTTLLRAPGDRLAQRTEIFIWRSFEEDMLVFSSKRTIPAAPGVLSARGMGHQISRLAPLALAPPSAAAAECFDTGDWTGPRAFAGTPSPAAAGAEPKLIRSNRSPSPPPPPRPLFLLFFFASLAAFLAFLLFLPSMLSLPATATSGICVAPSGVDGGLETTSRCLSSGMVSSSRKGVLRSMAERSGSPARVLGRVTGATPAGASSSSLAPRP